MIDSKLNEEKKELKWIDFEEWKFQRDWHTIKRREIIPSYLWATFGL